MGRARGDAAEGGLAVVDQPLVRFHLSAEAGPAL